jgi:holliday junction DNA helicase RuvA
MIGYLEGRALTADILLVGGVGYRVSTAAGLSVGVECALWIHTVVHENELSLYGFEQVAQRDVFLALTRVTGVGPRVALALLSLGGPELAGAISTNDVRALSQAPGIGPKKAAQILAALSVPTAVLEALAGGPVVVDPLEDMVAALVSMNHSPAVARAALVQAALDAPDAAPPMLLRAAVRSLAALARVA